MKAPGWLKEVYEKIDAQFRSEDLPRIIRLVQQPSIAGTGEGIAECAQLVMEMLRDLGCENVHLEHYVHSPIVEGFLPSTVEDAPTIILYGMYDVQPPEPLEEWSVPPFQGTIVENHMGNGECVVARGIANSKGPLVCYMNAIRTIRQVLGYVPVNILFVVEGEEEMSSESLAKYVEKHAERLSKCDLVFMNGCREDENGWPTTNLGNKGILYLDLECRGGAWGGPQKVDVHSKNAAWLSNPIWRLINALATMRDAQDNILIDGFYDDVILPTPLEEQLTAGMVELAKPETILKKELCASRFMKGWSAGEAMRKLIWSPTLNICGISGGYEGAAAKTIIPYKVNAKIDIRMVPNMTAEKTLALIQNHLKQHGFDDIKVTVVSTTPSAKVDPECTAVQAAFAALDSFEREKWGAWPIFPGSGPRYLFTDPPVSIPYITLGLGRWGRIHAPDEWVTMQGLQDNEKSCAAYIYYYLEECSKKKGRTAEREVQ